MKLVYVLYVISILIYLTLITILLYIMDKNNPLMWSIYCVGLVTLLFGFYFMMNSANLSIGFITNCIGFAFLYAAFLKVTFTQGSIDQTLIYAGHGVNIFMFLLSTGLLYVSNSFDSGYNYKNDINESNEGNFNENSYSANMITSADGRSVRPSKELIKIVL